MEVEMGGLRGGCGDASSRGLGERGRERIRGYEREVCGVDRRCVAGHVWCWVVSHEFERLVRTA